MDAELVKRRPDTRDAQVFVGGFYGRGDRGCCTPKKIDEKRCVYPLILYWLIII